jgi:hypothetical protein
MPNFIDELSCTDEVTTDEMSTDELTTDEMTGCAQLSSTRKNRRTTIARVTLFKVYSLIFQSIDGWNRDVSSILSSILRRCVFKKLIERNLEY